MVAMRLAVIGSYGHVNLVMEGLRHLPRVQLVAAARWGPDDPMSFLRHEAAPAGLSIYDDYRGMLLNERPEVAVVCMPLYRLAEASIAAAEAGCHVFSEKPLATTLADLDRLRTAVARSGVQLAAMLAMRGEPAFRTIRQAIRAGRIGRVLYATAQKSYPFNRRDDFYKNRQTYGGSIPWQLIHALDYVAWCTGQDYRRVAAMADNLAHPTHPGMEDQGGVLAKLSGGGTAVFNFDYLRPWGKHARPWGDDRLRIAGTDGIIETKDSAKAVELTTPDNTELLPLEPARNLFADWITALAGQGESPITSEESFRITEVALRAREAQDAGCAIDL